MKVKNIDEAKNLGLSKFRELYPAGQIPAEVENHGVLSVGPSKESFEVVIIYPLRKQVDPYVLFRANINKETGEVKVIEAASSAPLSSVEQLDLKSHANLRERPDDAL